jgi:hypothetical protein
VFDGRGETSVDMTIIQLAVKDQKVRIVVDNRSNRLCLWPWSLLVELLSKSVESDLSSKPCSDILIFVASLHFVHVVLKICVIEMG